MKLKFSAALLLVLLLPLATPAAAVDTSGQLEPDPRYTPDQVVKIQLEALQRNDIETTFEFASPANKVQTGPLERFTQMINGPLYRPMIDSRTIEYLTIDIDENLAVQRVRLFAETGEEIVYVFYLAKQEASPYEDCWMTEAVYIESWKEGGVSI
jgi:hypothetical protein